ncbi:MAG: enoyl-CoA hydratase-related protein [Acidimicrobiales bacterium]|nr:enoyl-CoA hydratase-related protein [Acidimicrobiales bacterium]
MSETTSLLHEREGAVLVLTLNRPERGNALDAPTITALLDVLDGLEADPGEVRAVVLRGAGRHFCTGADIGGGGGDGGRPSVGHITRGLVTGPHLLVKRLWECRLPIVVELTGRTSGLGLHVALTGDTTVAAESASFAEPFSDRGFNVDSGGSWLLPRMIGLSRAKRMLYTAEVVDAATAVDWGLVTEVVPDDEVGERALALAAELARRPTFSLGATKGLLHRHLDGDLADALEDEAAAIELTVRSDDFKEGMRAFVEKRPPDFTGR